MARPGARADRYDIETDGGVGKPWTRGEEILRGARDTHLLARLDRFRREREVGSSLDLDEADRAGWRLGNEIDLAHMRANAAAENAIELQGQENRRKRFAAPAATFSP
jgi:hypothetical protein